MAQSDESAKHDKRVEALIRAAREAIPYTGSASALYEGIIRPQLTRRGYEFLQGLLDRLLGIEGAYPAFDLEATLANPDFAAFVTDATHVAARTRNAEKMEALRNAVLNVAVGTTIDEDLQEIFLRAVENLTPSHLRMLRFAQDPAGAATALGVETTPSPPLYEQALSIVFPEFRQRPDVYRQLYEDLVTRGFILSSSNLGVSQGRSIKRTTELGEQFLAFIADPQEGAT